METVQSPSHGAIPPSWIFHAVLCALSFRVTHAQCSDPRSRVAAVAWSYLESPNFPEPYYPGVDNCWFVSTYGSERVQLEVLDTKIQYSPECLTADYVDIREGSTYDSSISVSRFCGSQRPSILTNGSDLLVHFHSDQRIHENGFRLRYRAVSQGDAANVPQLRMQTDTCSETENLVPDSTDKELISPGFPTVYAGGLSLCWSITASSSDVYIRVTVEDTRMETNLFCVDGDFVEVRDEGEDFDTQLQLWCGSQEPGVFNSETHSISIRFESDGDDNNHSGFRLTYKAIAYPQDEESGSKVTIWVAIGVTAAACLLLWILLTAYKRYKRQNAATVDISPRGNVQQNINRQRPARRRNSVCDIGPQQPGYGQFRAPPPYPPSGQPNPDPIYSPGQPPPYTIPETPPPPYDNPPETISSGQEKF